MTHHLRSAYVLAATLLVVAFSSASAQEVEKTPPGLEIGKPAPAFKLADQNGKEQSLSELLKRGNVALVFYRSADW